MVQTYQSPVRIYKYPFELVMAAYHKRFPTCPQIPIFVGSEITHEWKAEDGGEEIIERKCQLNVDAPYLIKKVAGIDYVYFKQRNHLDMRSRTLLIEASNISFSSRIVVVENCRYYVHTENPEWTCFEQSASLDVKSFFGFESAIEKLAVKQYGANIAKGKEVLEFFIDDLVKNGVEHVPRWAVDGKDAIKKITTADLEKPNGKALTEKNSSGGEADKMPDRMSPPNTPPASSSGFGGSCSTTTTSNAAVLANELNSEPLSGTSEELISREELKRRRSSGLGGGGSARGNKASIGAAVSATVAPSLQTAVSVSARLGSADPSARTMSFDDLDSKLESDYIQRTLGQLSSLQESRLCELKYGLQSANKGKIPNDAHLLRFLRARDFEVQKATQMVNKSLLWRKQHNVDKILQDFVPPPLLLKYFPGGWHQCDLKGRPLFILRIGQLDIKGLLRSVGLEAIVKFTLSICEQGLLKTAEATNRLEKPISTWSLLIDLEGLSMRHLWRPGVQSLLRIIEILEAHYPECLGMVLVIRAPRAFPILWTLISPFIDENTRKKFQLYANDQLLPEELARYIPEEYLPDFLGGKCKFECAGDGGGSPIWMVPKSEYLSVTGGELRRENADDILTSTYTNVVVNRGSPYEICVWVEQPGSVLTWDFDIIKGECEFLVYHTEKKITPKATLSGQTSVTTTTTAAVQSTAGVGPPPSTHGPLDRVVDTVASELSNLLSNNPPAPHFHAIACEPEFRVGTELTIVNHPEDFKESDSMQGSTFCTAPGTFILQWRHPSDFSSASAAESGVASLHKKDSLPSGEGGATTASGVHSGTPSQKTSITGTTHKCRLMVYHELLNSADFKGSVDSLESCRTSFNSLAAAAAAPSDPSTPQHSSTTAIEAQKNNNNNSTATETKEKEEETVGGESSTTKPEELLMAKTD